MKRPIASRTFFGLTVNEVSAVVVALVLWSIALDLIFRVAVS